jgi:hypothetical protein
LNFIQNFKTSGHKLSLDFKHEINNEDELATLTGSQFFPNIINDIVQKTDAIEHQKKNSCPRRLCIAYWRKRTI